MLGRLSTAVHESAHYVGFQKLSASRYTYATSGSVSEWLSVAQVSIFNRDRISSALPPELADLSYNSIYLTGSSGAQDIEQLLDELNAYTWSLYIDYALLDQITGRRVSARDGLLTFLVYLELYLHIARTEEPKDYARITKNDSLRTTILTLWDRARCVLALSGDDPRLGIEEARIRPFVFGASKLGEVEMLRTR